MKKIFLLLLAGGIIAIIILLFAGSKVTGNLDSYVYYLPFKQGSGYKVVQGYGGLFSHKNIAALDFSMPEGTAVYAAREGTIYSYKDDSDEGGLLRSNKRKANYIIIKHDDGSFGCYWHLQKNGVAIKKGPVKKGALIGYSGSTGFVLRPHLHFSVKKKLNYDKDSFVKTKFITTEGIQLLESGKTYTKP